MKGRIMGTLWSSLTVAAALCLAGVGCQNKMYSENKDLRQQNLALQRELDDARKQQQAPQPVVASPPQQANVQPNPPVTKPEVASNPAPPSHAPGAGSHTPDMGNLDVTHDPAAHTTTVNLPSDVFFGPGQATLLPDAKKSLAKVISVLKKEYARKPIRIEGHTDSDPIVKSHWKSNQQLSEKRAEAVKDYLVSKGISADRITTKGYGDTKPKSSTNKQKNRRVELVVLQTR